MPEAVNTTDGEDANGPMLTPVAQMATAFYLILICVFGVVTYPDRKLFFRVAIIFTNVWLLLLSVISVLYGNDPDRAMGILGTVLFSVSLSSIAAYFCIVSVNQRAGNGYTRVVPEGDSELASVKRADEKDEAVDL
jgi:hypothetical protein